MRIDVREVRQLEAGPPVLWCGKTPAGEYIFFRSRHGVWVIETKDRVIISTADQAGCHNDWAAFKASAASRGFRIEEVA